MLFVIIAPLALAAVAFATPSNRHRPVALLAGALLHAGGVARLFVTSPTAGDGAWLALDALGKITLLTTTILFLASSVYAQGYLAQRPDRDNRVFVGGLLGLLGAMTTVALSHHLGLTWVAMEASTLCTAPLIYFNHIALALLGTFFLALSGAVPGGPHSLVVEHLVAAGPLLSRPWVRAGFVFLLVGYGTKMGLAPLHSWKPDARGRRGRLRPRRARRPRPPLDRARRGVRRRAEGLQAHAGLLQRRAHGDPRARPGPRRRRRGRRLLPPPQQRPHEGGRVPLRRQHPPRVRIEDDRRGARGGAPAPRVGTAVPGGVSRHHRLAAVQPVLQRVPDPERRLRRGPLRSRRAVPRVPRGDLRRDGDDRPRGGAGRPRSDPAPAHDVEPLAHGRPAARHAGARPLPRALPAAGAEGPLRLGGGPGGRKVGVNMTEALRPRAGDRNAPVLETWNGEAIDARTVPVLPVERFRAVVLGVLRAGGRISALFGRPAGGRTLLTAVLADDPEGKLGILSTEVDGAYPALSAEAPAAQGFEREIAEQFGVRP